jgi:hypothetical protein
MSAQDHLGPQFTMEQAKGSVLSERIVAKSGNEEVGHLDYAHMPRHNVTNIVWVQSRAKGAGTALLHHLAQTHPDSELATAEVTPSGRALLASYTRRTGRKVSIDSDE